MYKLNIRKFENFIISILLLSLISCEAEQGRFREEKSILLEIKKGFTVFFDKDTEKEILSWQKKENRKFGLETHQTKYKRIKLKGTNLMQRSGRKRLLDHNIFLRSIFQGRISHKKYGLLKDSFSKSVFVDIGSAILMDDGAPTVRDIFEDRSVNSYFKAVIATDINDPNNPSARYIDIYKKTRNNIPFPVREVAMVVDDEAKLKSLTDSYLGQGISIIYRSANSGPDLFYTTEELINHFRAMIRFNYKRDIIYFFNKFVLYKNKDEFSFQILGICDPRVGTSHRSHSWQDINWTKRKLKDAFRHNPKFLEKPI